MRNLPLEKLNGFTFNHSDQQDRLYDVMSSEEVKQAFDSRGEELREIYNQLIDKLQDVTDGDSGADNVKATPISNSPDTVQGILEWLKSQIDLAVLGGIPDGTITDVKLSDAEGQIKEIVNRLRYKSTDQDKEIAFLKLKQEASERIENGTTFADDMDGNRFGMTFNEEESSNVSIRNGSMKMAEAVVTTVEDAVVTSNPYSVGFNGGRKLVKLSNGWFVVVSQGTDNYYFQVDKQDGNGFVPLCYINNANIDTNEIAITSFGTSIYAIHGYSSTSVYAYSFDATTIPNMNIWENATYGKSQLIESNQTQLPKAGNMAIVVNGDGTELHACWSSKNSTYPNSLNIRYAKGTINADGNVVWGTVEFRTAANSTGTNQIQPTIAVNNEGNPVIVYMDTGSSWHIVKCTYFNGSTWTQQRVVYNGSNFSQSYPSMVSVPSTVNGLPNGRIWATWTGLDSVDTSKNNIRVSYSDDLGYTWSTPYKITSGNSYYQNLPSITADKNNNVFVVWAGRGNGSSDSVYNIRSSKFDGTNWSEPKQITNATEVSTECSYPSTLVDLTMNISEPIFVYTQSNTKVGMYGEWYVENQTTSSTAIYDLPSTEYVGTFVKKDGNVNVEAYINDIQMDSNLEGNEYMFTKALSSDSPVKLRLELSRADTTGGNNDKVTRILGGIN